MRKFCLVALAGLGMISLRAYAFWSGIPINAGSLHLVNIIDDHGDITKEAIGPANTFQYSTSTGQYPFSLQAIRAIIKANDALDQTAINPYAAGDHFDGQAFVDGLNRLAKRRQHLMEFLSPPVSADSQLQAWKMLGYMLHSAQDFYAHSTWVELGRAGIVNFGALTENTPPDYTTLTPTTATVCAAGGFPLLVPVVPMLTTGYFDPTERSADPAPPGLCQHGTLAQAESTCLLGALGANGVVPVSGISKDSPCAAYPLAPAAHILAYKKAVDETRSLVNAIIVDLHKSGNAAGFCALLGLSPTDASVCQSSWAGTLQGTLPLTGFTFACSPGPTCTVNDVTFAVSIAQNGVVSTSPVNQNGNWFLTNCAVCSPLNPLMGSYDWTLSSGTVTACTADSSPPCQSGSAILQLRYSENTTTLDGADYCSFTIILSPGSSGITPTAKQGGLCNYAAAGLQATLPSDTGPPAVTFTAASQ